MRGPDWQATSSAGATICRAYDAELRDDRLTGEPVATPECPTPTDEPEPGLPDRLIVDGSRLRLVHEIAGGGEWEQVYGALVVDEPSAPVTTTPPDGPALADVEVPATTVPTPASAPCDQVATFASRLAATDVVTDLPPGGPPQELAARSRLVVRGFLTDATFGTAADPTDFTFVYDLVVEEVLRADDGVDVAPGTEVGVSLTFVLDGPDGSAPPLGDVAEVTGDRPDGAIPVVAFLTDEGATPRLWRVDGPYGLAVGCPGQLAGGLIGPEGWGMEMGELADNARG